MNVQWCAAALAVLASGLAVAQEPGAYVEIGVGGVGLGLPDYRGSDHYNVQAYPFPYLVYRSERVRVARDGIRASVFMHADATLTLSLAAGLPGDRNPDARAGMPELMPTFEAGPSLDFRLAGAWRSPFLMQLRIPARAVVATDLGNFESAGWLFHPHVRSDWRTSVGDWGVVSRLGGGPVWATRRYHAYFYEVDPAYATAARPAYDASGGYSGFRVGASMVAHRDRLRYGIFGSYDWLEGAAFRDSPLYENPHALIVGVYMTWQLWSSGDRRAVEEDDGS